MAKKALKKVVEKIEEPANDKEISGKQLYWIVGGMVFIIGVILLAYFISQNQYKFNYQGLSFTKERYGEIPVYHYYYYLDLPNGQQARYNLFLRNDPRTNNVSVQGDILFREFPIYFSIDSDALGSCENASLGVSSLAGFLINNNLEMKIATPNATEAVEKNVSYASCMEATNNTVILMRPGEESRITQSGNCYILSVANCDMLRVAEKFEVQSILDWKADRKTY